MLKKWTAVAVAVGGGFALVCAAIIAGVLWYSSRPAQWNTGALIASGGEIEMTVVSRENVPRHSDRIDYAALAEQARKARPPSTAPAQPTAPITFDPSEIRPVAPPSTSSSTAAAPVDPTGFRVSYTIENTTNRDITISPSATLMTRRASDGALDSPRVPVATPLTLFVPARQRVMFHVQITYACDEKGWGDWKPCFTHLLNDADGLVVIDTSQHLQLRLPKPFWNAGGVTAFETKP